MKPFSSLPDILIQDFGAVISDEREHDMEPIVELRQVVKEYPLGKVTVRALHGVDLSFQKGEFSVVAGPSGSGKTTLLNMIGCVDVPTSGLVTIEGVSTDALRDRKRTKLRLHKLGFIFQTFNLIPVLSAAQNVEFPLLLQGKHSRRQRKKLVEEMMEADLDEAARERTLVSAGYEVAYQEVD